MILVSQAPRPGHSGRLCPVSDSGEEVNTLTLTQFMTSIL